MARKTAKMWIRSELLLEVPKARSRRSYSSDSKVVELKALKPFIMKKVQNWAKDYRFHETAPVAQEVLKSRDLLYSGVSTLLHHLPVWACKYCPEVYIGERGHLIRTCGGYRRLAKFEAHKWIKALLNDILVPVEAVHYAQERSDHEHIPAVVELCLRAGATLPSEYPNSTEPGNRFETADLLDKEMESVAKETLSAYESVRNGVEKLMLVFPAKVCKLCSEVHVVPLGGVNESRHEAHVWQKAVVDDFVPPKIVWYRRPQDPWVLVDEGRDYYGHAPAVIDMCVKAGAAAPYKYISMMKDNGLSAPL
ncbi:unnamed protein product [Cuscuta europaea]|uniref:APO domain-containing protein n=1 Tax=Cuscuta europaea TaxID=41803 RepID=A0A9P1DWQ9_CUSEU|nr:unnamed protein product [Cuscuta europaea]